MRIRVSPSEVDKLFVTPSLPRRFGNIYRIYFKRTLDIALVLLAALPTILVLSVLCLAIMRDGASPFYRQQRVGRHGRSFHMWKLRSMVPNADRLLEAYLVDNPAAREEWDRRQKLGHDPRITRIGRLIRATSLDELPQLWNVLRGDMSLVGPRPMMTCQTSIYPGTAYYALRPGITGYWQTAVRNESSFVQRADFDTQYLRDLSIATDLKLLARTVKVVFRGTGV
ncbi:sugar transferase [Citreimonas salinaria]|uniref:sugar transferase n=1 Tax=Citreimonas salinaria TaxID=321339 RepID=UPI003CCBF1D1